MDAKGVRNMYSILVVVNKHNTARVASCWFIIYYSYSMTFACGDMRELYTLKLFKSIIVVQEVGKYQLC